jgi:chorismate mutase/prephenate dehydrogenase
MGGWLTEYMRSLGHSLVVSDAASGQMGSSLESQEITIVSGNVAAVEDADVVIISVPIENTKEIINEVVQHMKEKAVLCEISSVKGKTPMTLQESAVHNVRPLCIHPLFGPGVSFQTKKIVLLPIIDSDSELHLVHTLFPDCQVVITTPEIHDRAMALNISLPYFVNMVLASVFAKEDLSLLQQLGGTTFAVQLLLTSSIMSNSPDLHRALHTTNEHTLGILRKFEFLFQKSLAALSEDIEEFVISYKALQESLEQSVSLNQKYSEMYHLLELMGRTTRTEVRSQ